ncbi:hypothetical protein EON82_02545 [bacterium]|nr:MAG: hypothetical protein EON82_02545 [bacterium]
MEPDQEWRDRLIRSILDGSGCPGEPYPYELYEEDFLDFVSRNGFPRSRVINLGHPGWGKDWTNLGYELRPETVGWVLRWFERGWEDRAFYATRVEAEEAVVHLMLGKNRRFFGKPRPRPGPARSAP